MPRFYYPHDNGGRPFEVEINRKRVTIYSLDPDDEHEEYDHFVAEFSDIKKTWIGVDRVYKDEKGTAILLERSDGSLVFVGMNVFSFRLAEPGEKIIQFVADMGNSDVIYSYAITNCGRVYFLGTGFFVYANLAHVDSKDDPYDWMFQQQKGKRPSLLHPYEYHMIQERL